MTAAPGRHARSVFGVAPRGTSAGRIPREGDAKMPATGDAAPASPGRQWVPWTAGGLAEQRARLAAAPATLARRARRTGWLSSRAPRAGRRWPWPQADRVAVTPGGTLASAGRLLAAVILVVAQPGRHPAARFAAVPGRRGRRDLRRQPAVAGRCSASLTVAGLAAQLIVMYRLGRRGPQLLAVGLALPFLLLGLVITLDHGAAPPSQRPGHRATPSWPPRSARPLPAPGRRSGPGS